MPANPASFVKALLSTFAAFSPAVPSPFGLNSASPLDGGYSRLTIQYVMGYDWLQSITCDMILRSQISFMGIPFRYLWFAWIIALRE